MRKLRLYIYMYICIPVCTGYYILLRTMYTYLFSIYSFTFIYVQIKMHILNIS